MANETESMTDEKMKAAVEVHQRLADLAKQMIAEGIEPGLVCHAMLTIGTDGLLQAYGREHAMNGLRQCYAPIQEAVERDAQRGPETKQ